MTGCGGLGLGSLTVGSSGAEPADGGPATLSDSAAAETSERPTVRPPGADAAGGGGVGVDGEAPYTSPLCGISYGSCDPDQPACFVDDGGTCEPGACDNDASSETGAAACRAASTGAPTCSPVGQQAEGEPCTRSSDCAAELECISDTSETATGTGVCRRYCCSGSCSDPTSFCDIETVLGAKQLVPVCHKSEATCTPLANKPADGGCPGDLTCTVVEEGMVQTTACVTPGAASAGESCSTQNCGSGLACIGGVCKALCLVSAETYACPSGESCMPLTAVGESVGVCSE